MFIKILIVHVTGLALLIAICTSFPDSRTSISSLSHSRSVNGLRNNAIGGSLIYSAEVVPDEDDTKTSNESKAVTRIITDNSLRSERSNSGRKRSRSSRSHDNFDRSKRDPAASPDSSQRSLYDRVRNCVRNGMGQEYLTETNTRCAMMAWFRVFKIKEKTKCKNCNPFFYCWATAEVHGNCGHHRHGRMAAAAISDCAELRAPTIDSNMVIDEASERGRSGGTNGCNNFYLCSAGCRYSSSNDTCGAACH